MNIKNKMIYIIQDENNHVKIGHSNNPESRLKTLQCGTKSKLYLLKTIPSSNAMRHELCLHNLYKKYHIHGEWFKLPKPILNTLISDNCNLDILLNDVTPCRIYNLDKANKSKLINQLSINQLFIKKFFTIYSQFVTYSRTIWRTKYSNKFNKSPELINMSVRDSLGCSDEEFFNYIQSKFEVDMCLENSSYKVFSHTCKLYKKTWRLMPVINPNTFNLTDQTEYQICFHHTNIIPVFNQIVYDYIDDM